MAEEIKEELSDEEVLEKCVSDPEEYQIIIDRYTARLQRFVAMKFAVSREDTEDIVQEALVRGLLSLKRYNPKQKWSAWIYKIASNVGCNFLRQTNHTILRDGAHIYQSPSMLLEDSLDSSLLKEKLQRSLQLIDFKHRQILILHYFEHKSLKEVCGLMKLKSAHFKVLLDRARKEFWYSYYS